MDKREKTHNSTNTILMVKPAFFFQNPLTLADNAFQKQSQHLTNQQVHARCIQQFQNYVNVLRKSGVHVIVVDDTPQPVKPDAIFPNNWFTTHQDHIIIYPMASANRRQERGLPVISELEALGFQMPRIINLSDYECEDQIVEGTGSMIFDHQNKIVYGCKSERTTGKLFELIASKYYGYKSIFFTATDANGKLIYHTNVIMSVCSNFAIVCLEAIQEADRERIKACIEQSIGSNNQKKILIDLSLMQVANFCGNVLEVSDCEGKLILTMSTTAFQAYREEQKEAILNNVDRIVHVEIPTVEIYGGGGTRCMMAEIFLKRPKLKTE